MSRQLQPLCRPCLPTAEGWPLVYLRSPGAPLRPVACAEGCGRAARWLVAVPLAFGGELAGQPVAAAVARLRGLGWCCSECAHHECALLPAGPRVLRGAS